jgi:hypothetical protein
MNRRAFFRKLVLGTAAFTILPPASTYSRIWKATRQVNPMWVAAPYEYVKIQFAGKWGWIVINSEGEAPVFYRPPTGTDPERLFHSVPCEPKAGWDGCFNA